MLNVADGVQLILASGSPRRRELLTEVGLTFTVRTSECDESVLPEEGPQQMVERLALSKAQSVAKMFPDAWVVGADTTVTQRGEILGKPADDEDAVRMLLKLQGATHQVWSAFALLHTASRTQHLHSGVTEVAMIAQSEKELRQYVATGESRDKAGSYAIQGRGAYLITRIDGSYSNVVGLNISAFIAAARRFGVVW